MFGQQIVFFSPQQGLARIKAFFSSANESVHSELSTYPPTLTTVLRVCVRELVKTLRKDNSCAAREFVLAIYHELFIYDPVLVRTSTH